MENIEEQKSEDNLTSDIFGVTEYTPESPKKKDFLPWHKPRKQFVRQEQWRVQIIKMIEEVAPENNLLKYLGLPGEDLLDLRYFHHHVCVPKNLALRYVGFNYNANPSSANSSELNISMDEVSKLPNIDPGSIMFGDDICQIGNQESIAHARSVQLGPYDIINIDLCDGFSNQPLDQFEETHYSALHKLLTLQARRNRPWLLLLTTRTGSNHTHDEALKRLKALYHENLKNCPDFKKTSNDNFSVFDLASLEEVCKKEQSLSNIFLVSLCKWIASVTVGQVPPSKIEVKSVIGYKVEPNVDYQDLVSIAIKITPTMIAAPDKAGFVKQNNTEINECNMAVQALRRVYKQVNADELLSSVQNLMDDMIASSCELLEEARYDISMYREWAKQS